MSGQENLTAEQLASQQTMAALEESMGGLERYSVNVQAMEERAIAEKPKKGNIVPVKWVKLEDGQTITCRVLPPWTDKGPHAFIPYLRVVRHWKVGPAQNERVVCAKMLSKEADCYICEQMDLLSSTGNAADKDHADRIKPKQHFLWQIIDRDDPVWTEFDQEVAEKPELLGQIKIKFIQLPWQGHSQIMDLFSDPDYGEICHPLRGLDIKISRKGKELDTEYNVKPKRNNSPMVAKANGDPDVMAITKVLDSLEPLDEHPFFRIKPYDVNRALFLGLKPDDVQEQDRSLASGGGGQATSYSGAPAASLSSGAPSMAYNDWVAHIERRAQETKIAGPMTAEQAAAWGGWNISQIEPCYAEEPDNGHPACLRCPLQAPCVISYKNKTGHYSVNPPAPASASIGKGGSPSSIGKSSSKEEDKLNELVGQLDSASRS